MSNATQIQDLNIPNVLSNINFRLPVYKQTNTCTIVSHVSSAI